MKDRVSAVIVTYNKPKILEKCLTAISQQTHLISDLTIVDNGIGFNNRDIVKSIDFPNSTNVHYHLMKKNLGGAGGFAWGIRSAMSDDNDFIWVMDDDTVPYPDALENLLKPVAAGSYDEGSIGLVASKVIWKDGSIAKMNVPTFLDSKIPEWSVPNEVARIRSSSFVSMLISTTAILEVGLPIPEFFIWGDDVEYSTRISQKFVCLFSPESVVRHLMAENIGINIRTENSVERIPRYYYQIRNTLYIIKHYGTYSERLLRELKDLVLILLVLPRKYGLLKASTIVKGLRASVTFRPIAKKVTSSVKGQP